MRDSRINTQEARNARERVSLNPESRILNPASGIALLAVMSAVSVMLLVALAFSGSVQIETRSTIYRKQATQAYAMAVGGVQAAILEIAYPPARIRVTSRAFGAKGNARCGCLTRREWRWWKS